MREFGFELRLCARLEADGRLVDPARDCGPTCPGYDPGEPPAVDLAAERDRTSPWLAEPDGRATTQSGLDRFG